METSKKLIENVSKMPAAAQQNPTTQANVAQAKGVVVKDAQKRIDNISKMPPEARQNPKVQQALAEAQKTVEAHGQKPEKQSEHPSDAQIKEQATPERQSREDSASGKLGVGQPPPAINEGSQGGAAATAQTSDAGTAGTSGPGNSKPAASSSSAIPDAITPSGSDSGQQSQTTANDGKPPSTSSSPVPTPGEFSAAHQVINKLKTQESPLSADQQKDLDAAEKTVARKTEDNILKQKAAIEARGGTLHPTAAKALADAQARLARPTPEGSNTQPEKGAEAATMAPGAPQPQNAASGSRLQFSQGGAANPNAGQAMQSLAGDDGRFRRGKASQSTDFRDIAKEYALPGELKNVHEQKPFGNESTKKVYRMDLKAGGHAYLLHGTNGKVWVDTSKMRIKDGQPAEGGDLVYQAAMTYAHNNGLKFVEDPRGVSPIARFRRMSQMLSNALRHRTTEHLSPYPETDANPNDASIPGWQQQQGRQDTAAYENNINQLALAEMNGVQKTMQHKADFDQERRKVLTMLRRPLPESGPLDNVQLHDLKWDPKDDSVTHVPTGRRLSEGDFDQIVSGLDPARSGVGKTTLSRALIARQALLGNVPGGDSVPNLESEISGGRGREEADVHGSKLFKLLEEDKKLFYSQPGASEVGGLDRGGRGRDRKLASHFDTDPRQLAQQTAQSVNTLNERVPGLINDKTHVFHSTEDLLNSDYAKQHPFSKEDIAGLQNAEGFHDPKTGHSAVIASNVELRPGETPHDALTRVILHERVGHDGLQTLLGSKDSKAQKHWEGLTQRIKPEELDAIANQEGYKHLKDDRNALAHEWFARQAEKSPHLLKKPGLLRDMWETFKGQLRKISNHWKDTEESHLDTHLQELLRHSRNAALRVPSVSQADGSTARPAPNRR